MVGRCDPRSRTFSCHQGVVGVLFQQRCLVYVSALHTISARCGPAQSLVAGMSITLILFVYIHVILKALTPDSPKIFRWSRDGLDDWANPKLTAEASFPYSRVPFLEQQEFENAFAGYPVQAHQEQKAKGSRPVK